MKKTIKAIFREIVKFAISFISSAFIVKWLASIRPEVTTFGGNVLMFAIMLIFVYVIISAMTAAKPKSAKYRRREARMAHRKGV